MAVGARPVEGEACGGQLRSGGMPRLDMTPLAQQRRSSLQQLRIAGPVRVMTIQAILHHRRMFPEERPAPFRMARVACLVRRSGDEEFGIGRAVRVVTARAGHLALAERHMRRPHELRAAHLVALEADFHLRLLDELAVVVQRLRKTAALREWVHDLMARYAGQAPRFVRASLPERALPFFVALQALAVFYFDGLRRVLTEADD